MISDYGTDKKNQLSEFIEERENGELGASIRSIEQAVDRVKNNINWMDQNYQKITNWFQQNLQLKKL